MIIDTALAERQRTGRPIRIGLVGAGFMGRSMTRQIIQFIEGMDVVAISNRTVDHAARCFADAGVDEVRQASDTVEFEAAVTKGSRVMTDDPTLICRSPSIDAVIEATGELEFGAQVAVEAIDAGKDVLLVNAELDATVGPILKARADRAGVVITNADGDEPGVAMNLVRFVRTIGLRPVMAGNIKGFYDPHRDPDTQLGFAQAHGLTPKMATSFADGTKLSMECAVLANATGFGVAKRGMIGHRCAHVRELATLHDPLDLLERPLVDFVVGAEPGSGTFVVGYDDDEDRAKYMAYFKMGDGPLYVFYRPFHITHLEAPLSVARAVLFRDATVAPIGGPACEVVAVAKRDLQPGDVLDGVGGFTCYGMIEGTVASRDEDLLPMGLIDGCTVRRPVPQDQALGFEDVEIPAGRLIDQLWREQAERFGMGLKRSEVPKVAALGSAVGTPR